GHIVPLFKQKTGIDVKVIAQGTGQALATARRDDAHVVFVHAKPQEEKFVAEGHGLHRHPVMDNDFVIIGPKDDPARLNGKDVLRAPQPTEGERGSSSPRGRLARTHSAGLNLWKEAGIDIAKDKGPWYKESGQGMGAALNMTSSTGACVLSDRGTWSSFKNKG